MSSNLFLFFVRTIIMGMDKGGYHSYRDICVVVFLIGGILSGYLGWLIPVCLGSFRYSIVGSAVRFWLIKQGPKRKDLLYKKDSWLALTMYVGSGIGESQMYVQVRVNYSQRPGGRREIHTRNANIPAYLLELTQESQ